MNNVKKNQILFILLFLLAFFSSCHGPTETFTQYYTPCFKEDNSILFIKHQKHYKGYFLPFLCLGDYKTYLCEMDINGENEELICQLPEDKFNYSYFREGNINLSYGNGIIGITSPYYFFIYVNNDIEQILENISDALISYNGTKIGYSKNNEPQANIICISDKDGLDEYEYFPGYILAWTPDNNSIVYSIQGEYAVLNITTSNTQPIPFNYHWSHDMQRIAYYDTNIDRLVIMDSDESNKVVTDWNGKISCWSYDGEYILSEFNLLDKNGNYIRTLREED